MKLLDKLDRIIRPIAIPNLTTIIIVGQVVMLFATAGKAATLQRAMLQWNLVVEGEVWRTITFLFVPPSTSPIFLLFALYLFYMFGTSLERQWGTVRYNTFLYLGWVLTVAAAGIVYDQGVTGTFLMGTVFLAFATYNPNFELRLFFVLPVKIKWLAYIQAAGYVVVIVFGTMSARVMALASIGNYLIFFGPSVFERLWHVRRQIQWQSRQLDLGSEPRHRCVSCGIDSNTDPNMDFRYCSQCDGQCAYCEDHLRDHQHVVEDS